MHLKQLSLRRENDYGYGRIDPSKPIIATIEMEGESTKVTLTLDPDVSKRILALIADEVAAAGRATAERMTREVINGTALLGAA